MCAARQSDSSESESDAIDDGYLVSRTSRGDAEALRLLMSRYDRLVRFAVFQLSRDRCLRDPQWLDGLASEIWAAFVQRIRVLSGTLQSPKALLLSIARNRTVSALRGSIREANHGSHALGLGGEQDISSADSDDPAVFLARLEHLAALQTCRDALSAEDRRITTQLDAILDRRWEAAANALGMPESTLRSRWKGVLGQLRRCLETKTGRDFAPSTEPGD